MIGSVYADESEAEKFFRKVDSKKRSRYRWERCPKKKKSALSKDKIDKSMISSPQIRFLQAHCPHGVRGWYGVVIREWSSESVDSSWVALLKDLEGEGVSRQSIQQEIEYIKPFVRDAQDAPKRKTKPQPPPAPHCRSHVPGTSTDV